MLLCCKFFLTVLDVTQPLLVEVDQIYHLACPASPIFYKHNPVKVCKSLFCEKYIISLFFLTVHCIEMSIIS